MQQETPLALAIDDILSNLAAQLPGLVSVTCCRAGLLDGQGEHFTIRTAHAVRDIPWTPRVGDEFVLDAVPRLRPTVDTGQPVVLPPEDVRRLAAADPAYPLLDQGLQSLALVPLARGQRVLGLISLGEMRSWDRSPITPHKLDICNAIASQTAVALQAAMDLHAIRTKQQVLGHLLDLPIADFLIAIDARRRITWVNRAAAGLTRWPREQILGRPCPEVFKGCNQERCPLILALQGRRVGPALLDMNACIAQHTPQLYLVCMAAPAFNETGRVEGAVVLFWDTSASEVALSSQDDWRAALTHELRAPLANLVVATNAALRYGKYDEQVKGLLHTVGLQSDRLRTIVELLLDPDWENSHLGASLQPVNLAQALTKAKTLYEGLASSHPIDVQITDDATWALADERYLMVILSNLLDNAIKYSPGGGAIHVSIEGYDKDCVAITVTDQGVGIPAEHLDKIFGKFYRVQSDQAPPVDGSGLGLYIVKRLLEAQNGQIWGKTQPGKGTSFSLTLPRLKSETATD